MPRPFKTLNLFGARFSSLPTLANRLLLEDQQLPSEFLATFLQKARHHLLSYPVKFSAWPTLSFVSTPGPSRPQVPSSSPRLPCTMSKVEPGPSYSTVSRVSRRRSSTRAPISWFHGCRNPSSTTSGRSRGTLARRLGARICRWSA